MATNKQKGSGIGALIGATLAGGGAALTWAVLNKNKNKNKK